MTRPAPICPTCGLKRLKKIPHNGPICLTRKLEAAGYERLSGERGRKSTFEVLQAAGVVERHRTAEGTAMEAWAPRWLVDVALYFQRLPLRQTPAFRARVAMLSELAGDPDGQTRAEAYLALSAPLDSEESD